MAPVRSRTRHRVFALTLLAALMGALVLATGASADLLTPESGGGSVNAEKIDTLYKLILAVAVVVFVGVEGVLLYSLIKFRVRKGAVPAQIRGNTRLEVGWTLGAAGILVILSVITFVMLDDIRTPPNSDPDGFPTQRVADVENATAYEPKPPNGRALNIEVTGMRYVWRYTYPDADDNVLNNVFNYHTLVVPTKTTVTLMIRAQDVAHSWWIPALGGKADAVPGHTNFTWFKVQRPGTFDGQCAELCGRNHQDMFAEVDAREPAEFKRWLEEKRREIDANNEGAQQRRQQESEDLQEGAAPSGSGNAEPPQGQ